MAIQLNKGQHIELTRDDPELTHIKVCLGWDEFKPEPDGGFLKKLFGGRAPANVDCDAAVLMLNAQNKLSSKKDAIYFGNLKHHSASVRHSGDNLTGEGPGDDEVIFVDLQGVPDYVQRLRFVITVFHAVKRKQDISLMDNAFIRIVNGNGNQELMRFDLNERYSGHTSLTVGELYRDERDWKFAAIGEGAADVSIGDLIKRYF